MAMCYWSKQVTLAALALLLAGCSTIPESIQTRSERPYDRLPQITLMPQMALGQEARLGGRVVAVQNDNDQTRLVIVSMPLDRWARPQLESVSQGRFIANVKGFLEPLDFQGRLVTVVGSVAEIEQGQIGNRPYHFVVINVTGYQRWNETQQVILPPGAADPWGWDWRYRRGWGFGNDWGPARIETIVTQ